MRYYFLLVSVLLLQMSGYAQKQNIYQLQIPHNIDDCFEVLDQTLSDESIKMLMEIPEDSAISFFYKSDEVNLVAVWGLNENSVLAKYFNRKGLETSSEMFRCIITSYQRYLNGDPVELNDQIADFKAKRIEYEKLLLAQLEADTVRGIYIPKDLPDCFRVLNETLTPEEIMIITNIPSRDVVIKYLPHVCIWLKQAWLLDEPTRLQLYMIHRGVEKPNFMSLIIMRFYYDYLHDDNQAWQNFDVRS